MNSAVAAAARPSPPKLHITIYPWRSVMFIFQYPIARLAHGVALHDLRQSKLLISVLFVWLFQPTCRGLGTTQGRFMRMCVFFEVLAGHSGFRGRDELRNEFGENVEEGGEDCLKGAQRVCSSSEYSYVVSGSCREEQWLITIKLL